MMPIDLKIFHQTLEDLITAGARVQILPFAPAPFKVSVKIKHLGGEFYGFADEVFPALNRAYRHWGTHTRAKAKEEKKEAPMSEEAPYYGKRRIKGFVIRETCKKCGGHGVMRPLICSSCGDRMYVDTVMPPEEFVKHLEFVPTTRSLDGEIVHLEHFKWKEEV